MLEEWLDVAAKEDYIKPSVYQGQYNLFCRGAEDSLFTLLRKHNMVFNAYSPLAGGFLLGNFTADGLQAGSRFVAGSPFVSWYDKPSMHAAVKELRVIAGDAGLGMDELALRWIVHHSILEKDDGVILGASKIQQVEKNVAQILKGRLEEGTVRRMEGLWESVRADASSIVP